MKRLFFTILSFLCISAFAQTQQKDEYKFPFQNPDFPVSERVKDLVSRMTLEEKISVMHGDFPGVPRLEVAKYSHGNEALHGVVRPGNFTVFPQAIAFAATWNPELIGKVADAISTEARGKWNGYDRGKTLTDQYSDLLAFWSPTINLARDPRWGRTPETYGEDPFLTSRIGVAFVKGMQGNDPKYLKVVSTPKHFAANNEEHNRLRCNAVVPERSFREYYLKAFKACVEEGKAQSIMSAYNAINGVPASINHELLTDILRNEWGFKGYVVSDCGAPTFVVQDHKYLNDYAEAAAKMVKAGLDLECGAGTCFECNVLLNYLKEANEKGLITEDEISRSASRILEARFKLGFFDPNGLCPYDTISPNVVGCEKHHELALETARQSMVLLKNDKNFLPINARNIKTIAVVGPNAAHCEFGDYSGTPVHEPVSPLQGIINRAGSGIKVTHIPWIEKVNGDMEQVPEDVLFHAEDGTLKPGLSAEYFSNRELAGKSFMRVEKQLFFDPKNQPPAPGIPGWPMSARWSGILVPQITGEYEFGISYDDGIRLYIDDKLIVDSWVLPTTWDHVKVNLEAGRKHKFIVEYYKDRHEGYCKLFWKTPTLENKDYFANERKAARENDLVIAVLGINRNIEREGRDKKDIELPEDQQRFIQEIYKANPNTLVVMVAGSPLAINWINENIPAILSAWYPGEQGGTAIAEALFGDFSPAGRLPFTYYKSTSDLPPFDDYDIQKGRTYMYFKNKVLYPFGYGLSYSGFTYSKLKLNKSEVSKGENEITVSFDLKNSGNFDADEVPQIYVSQPGSPIVLPEKQLVGFKRVHLKKGETKTVGIPVDLNQLSYWNDKDKTFDMVPGIKEIKVGASSEDIRIKSIVKLLK